VHVVHGPKKYSKRGKNETLGGLPGRKAALRLTPFTGKKVGRFLEKEVSFWEGKMIERSPGEGTALSSGREEIGGDAAARERTGAKELTGKRN